MSVLVKYVRIIVFFSCLSHGVTASFEYVWMVMGWTVCVFVRRVTSSLNFNSFLGITMLAYLYIRTHILIPNPILKPK